jgi:hypothetical protein
LGVFMSGITPSSPSDSRTSNPIEGIKEAVSSTPKEKTPYLAGAGKTHLLASALTGKEGAMGKVVSIAKADLPSAGISATTVDTDAWKDLYLYYRGGGYIDADGEYQRPNTGPDAGWAPPST